MLQSGKKQSRFEDDGWDIPDDLEDWGGGVFYDPEDGSYYYDSDGDGEPDSFYIEGGNCEGDQEIGGSDDGITPFPGWNGNGVNEGNDKMMGMLEKYI